MIYQDLLLLFNLFRFFVYVRQNENKSKGFIQLTIKMIFTNIENTDDMCKRYLGKCIVCFREQDIFNQAISRGQDGRKDLLERKFCNFITGVEQNCGEDLVGQCYDEKQVKVWTDMNLEVILDQAESLFTGWDSMKCPIMR